MALEQAQENVAAPAVVPSKPASGLRKWLAIGTGVALEVDGLDLRALAVRVRPGGVTVLGEHRTQRYGERQAAEWGAELLAFLKQVGVGRRPVWLVLPRQEVIVRQLMLPGVEAKDLAAAIAFQIDSLHPYPEDAATYAWARLSFAGAVMVGIARREVVDSFANLFAEAGIPLAGFTFSAAAFHSAFRILLEPPPAFLTAHRDDGGLEIYGESPAKPLFSGVFEDGGERPLRLARGELRLESDAPVYRPTDLLPVPVRAPEGFDAASCPRLVAAAVAGACPRLALPANLLPEERRSQTSRLIYVPTAILSALLIGAAVALSLQPSFEDQRYLERLNAEIRALERQAARAAAIDKEVALAKERIALLDRHRQRSQADADALRELTRLLAPPTWLNSLQVSRTEVLMAGEAEQSAPLLRIIDDSPLFRDSSFSQAMTKVGGAESFIIRAAREGAGTGLEKGEQR